MVATMTAADPAISVDRKSLQAALKRIGNVIPSKSAKPILQCVHLETAGGTLRLSATDMDLSVSVAVDCDGDLCSCVVDARELARRINASKNPACSLRYDDEKAAIVVNGGRVEHTIATLSIDEFPIVPGGPNGQSVQIPAKKLQDALKTCITVAAREPSRYAINGALLESDSVGTRIVATDGRRMAVVEASGSTGDYSGSVILPLRFASLAAKFIDPKHEGEIDIFFEEEAALNGEESRPATVFICGPDWMLTSQAVEGNFPSYRDVVPPAGSKFVVDRADLVSLVSEVSIAADSLNRTVLLRFTDSALRVSTSSPGNGESSGSMNAFFEGGGDEAIVVGVNPAYLLDAIKSFTADEIVFDVRQNTLCQRTNSVRSSPVCIRERGSDSMTHVIMPVNLSLPPSLETLGRNCASLTA